MSDTETFVDEPSNPLPPAGTWHTLNYSQLLDAKTKLMDKIYLARGNTKYLTPLNAALARLDALLTSKLNDPRGLS